MFLPKPLFIAVTSFILAISAITAHAQQDLKVAYVNIQSIVKSSPQRAEAEKKFKEEFVGRSEEINKMQSEITALRDKYSREALTMSVEERTKFEKDFLAKQRKLKWEVSVFEEDQKLREKAMFNKINTDVFKAIQKLSQDGKYDLVLTEGVIFRSQRMDITDEVLEILKKEAKK